MDGSTLNKIQTLEASIGIRGHARIDSSTRSDVRKWLCANGVPSVNARQLTMSELRNAYNDTSNNALGNLINGWPDPDKDNHAATKQPQPKQPQPKQPKQPTPDTMPSKTNASAGVTDATTLELARLLSNLRSQANLDESRVVELIKEHSPVKQLEITRPDQSRHVVEGAHHKALPDLLAMLSAGCHVWLTGPSGSGKTHLAGQCADALSLAFYSTGAVTSDFRLMGFINAQGETVRTPFRDAFENGGVFLWDEIDASNPNALVAFNQALANGSYCFPDKMIKRHPDFIAIAAANTHGHGPTAEYVGRNRIDAATLDRFVTLFIDYDENLERQICPNKNWVNTVQRVRKAVREHGIKHIVSPRASIDGAKLLAAGIDRDTAINAVIRKSLSDDSWNKIKNTTMSN